MQRRAALVGTLFVFAVGCADTAGASSRPPVLTPGGPTVRDAGGGSGGGGGGTFVPGDVDGGAIADVPARDAGSTRDASVDTVARDVVSFDVPARDTGPEEICGNGLDDNRDGLIDEDCPATQCATPPPTRTRVWFVNGNAPTGLREALAARGLTLMTTAFSPDDLDSAAALVMQLNGTLDESFARRLRAWVDGGGGLVTLIVGSGAVSPVECDGPNVLIARFGLSYLCDAPVPWGPVERFYDHAVTADLAVENTPFVNGRAVGVRPGITAPPLVDVNGRVAARAVTSGCGRVVVWGDEHVRFDTYWPHQRVFWEQSLLWVTRR